MPPFASRQTPPPQSSGMPQWAVIALLALGGVAVVAIGLWLLWGGTAVVMSWLPTSVVRSVSEKAGDPKVVETQPDPEGAPWKTKAYINQDRADDKAEDQDTELAGQGTTEAADPQRDAAQAQAALAPITAAADAVDLAIAAWQNKPGDQALLLVTEKAIETLRTMQVRAGTSALRQAVQEQRSELVNQKRKALADAQRQTRASHRIKVTGGMAAMRRAANDESDEVAQVPDETPVHVFLDNGHGWSRIEVLTGDVAGKNGYVRSRDLAPLNR